MKTAVLIPLQATLHIPALEFTQVPFWKTGGLLGQNSQLGESN